MMTPDQKEKKKRYYEEHRAERIEYQKRYNAEHKEDLYIKSKEREKQYQKKYYQKRKKDPAFKALQEEKKRTRKKLKEKSLEIKKKERLLKIKKYREDNKERLSMLGKKWRLKHPDSLRDSQHRRRALKKKTKTEKFSSFDIFDRDRWVCGLCHKKVDRLLKWPDPMSASLDHIVPLSKGGTHTRDNVQIAHLICNEKAHTGGIKQLLIFG